jgi:molybdenum cofactor biosynthesis protein MoaC
VTTSIHDIRGTTNPLDRLCRPLHDLRISVMDRCNFRCPYCMPKDKFHDAYKFLNSSERLSFAEITRLARIFAGLGVRKLRLTGGEPLLRANLADLVGDLTGIPGIEDIALTTNGVLLSQHAVDLYANGLKRVTVSLDTLDPEVFKRMSGGFGALDQVLHGIDAAIEAGLAPIKINAVIERGVNEHGVFDLVERFRGCRSSCVSSNSWTSAIATTGARKWSYPRANSWRVFRRAGRCMRYRRITAAKSRSAGDSTTGSAKSASSPRFLSRFAQPAAERDSRRRESFILACSQPKAWICGPYCAAAPMTPSSRSRCAPPGSVAPIAIANSATSCAAASTGRKRSKCIISAVEAMPFSHLDSERRPTMVDVSDKTAGKRTAVAETTVRFPPKVADALRESGLRSAKGPVFDTAIVAGVMGAKRTHELIPFCHPLGLESCKIVIELVGDAAVIRCSVTVHHKTGVEMEALTGASIAALTIYDMCKALSHEIVISETRLLSKEGGKSDFGLQTAT